MKWQGPLICLAILAFAVVYGLWLGSRGVWL